MATSFPAALHHLQRQLGYRATLDDALKDAQLVPVTCAWCGSFQSVELWARSAGVLERGIPLELDPPSHGMCEGCSEWEQIESKADAERCACGLEAVDCAEMECREAEEIP